MSVAVAMLVGSLATTAATPGAEAVPPVDRVALLIGVNRSPDATLPALRYADDDAARFFDLFELLGVHAALLSAPDRDTAQLHPEAQARARPPTAAGLDGALDELHDEVAAARQRGVRSVAYVVYAGHGTSDGDGVRLALDDGGLDLEALGAVIDRIGADVTHVMVDACHAALLAAPRGPGGERVPAAGFSRLPSLLERPDVGLLVATSESQQTHEWEAYQGGVFAHEVRSGLSGAADVDLDGEVTYREMVSFVRRANQAIVNPRFRPEVIARAPLGGEVLVDLAISGAGEVAIEAAAPGHYYLEGPTGIRLADFHNAPGQEVRLRRPPTRIYVHSGDGQREAVLGPSSGPGRVSVSALQQASIAPRGAAHDAFTLLFSLPFGRGDVDGAVGVAGRRIASASPPWRALAYGGLGVGLASIAAGGATLASAHLLRSQVVTRSQRQTAAINAELERRNIVSGVLFGLGAAFAGAGAVFFALPSVDSAEVAPGVSSPVYGLTFAGGW